MTAERLELLFERNGYDKVPSNLPEFTFYYRREYQGAIVLHVIHYRQGLYISEDQYVHLKQKIMEFLHSKGEEEVHLLSLVLCDDMEKARKLCSDDSFCWMIDTAADRLIIYENQADDFYGWRGMLEEFLLHPDGEMSGDGIRVSGSGMSGDGADNNRAAYRNGRTSTFTDALRRSRENLHAKDLHTKSLPWVNICLVVANVIVFLICTFTGRVLYNKGALGVMYIIEDNSYYRLITSMFLHMDTGHLFSNMIVLYYVGEIVERRLGHVPYAVLYFLSGIAGGVLSMGYELLTGDYISSVGASGAVFGVEGALLLLVILHRGKLQSMTFGRVAFVIAFSLYSGFTGTDINNAAHIGGVLMGFAVAAVFGMLRPYIGTGKDGNFDEN